jgi:hypothetical protein
MSYMKTQINGYALLKTQKKNNIITKLNIL